MHDDLPLHKWQVMHGDLPLYRWQMMPDDLPLYRWQVMQILHRLCWPFMWLFIVTYLSTGDRWCRLHRLCWPFRCTWTVCDDLPVMHDDLPLYRWQVMQTAQVVLAIQVYVQVHLDCSWWLTCIQVTGDADPAQVVLAVQVYVDNQLLLIKALNDLFNLFRYSTLTNHRQALEVRTVVWVLLQWYRNLQWIKGDTRQRRKQIGLKTLTYLPTLLDFLEFL